MNDCYRHAKTQREYWTAGLDHTLANHFQSGLLDIPSYHSISSTNRELRFADGAGTTTKIVPIDDGGLILAIYRDLVEVFSKVKAEALPLHQSIEHAIDLEPGYNLPYGQIYNSSELG